MKRWALRLAMFLILGAIVNVAVAWGCAVAVRIDRAEQLPIVVYMTSDSLPCWNGIYLYRSGAGRCVYEWQGSETWESMGRPMYPGDPDVAPYWSRARTVRNGKDLQLLVEDARGWPCLSIRCRHITSLASDGRTVTVSDVAGGIAVDLGEQTPVPAGGIEIRPRFMYSTALPIIPIPRGFAINTIFYAAILWGLFAVPFALRRRMRIKRGLCVKCGYDLRGRTAHTSANICPECGTAAPSSKSIPP